MLLKIGFTKMLEYLKGYFPPHLCSFLKWKHEHFLETCIALEHLSAAIYRSLKYNPLVKYEHIQINLNSWLKLQPSISGQLPKIILWTYSTVQCFHKAEMQGSRWLCHYHYTLQEVKESNIARPNMINNQLHFSLFSFFIQF